MKKGKAAGPSGINVEILLAGGEDILFAITHLVFAEGRIRNDLSLSFVILI